MKNKILNYLLPNLQGMVWSMALMLLPLSATAQGIAFEPEGTTLEQASVKAKAENKLIFLDCFTTWCGPCKMMSNQVFPQEIVGTYMNPRFVSIKIDMESAYGAPLAKKLQIQAYPTFVIFNADAKEIGRFLGGSKAEEFLQKVQDKSRDDGSSELQARWDNGDRDPQFLMSYLNTLTATYKANDANNVAEALLEDKETTFAADSTLRMVFFRNITNPFAKSFIYTAKHPENLMAATGEMPVKMKVQNVLNNYQRQVITENADGSVTLDQEKFDKFQALLKDLAVPNADHYRLSTLITLAEKKKDYNAYLGYIREYLSNSNLDADDMQLARWVKPFTPETDNKYKQQMKAILQQRIALIKAGKRQAQSSVGNMRLSRPTDELLEMLVGVLDGKMPGQ
ncbi:MAG: thioredoxin family protein [Bacteroidaceae bacterium]|nr:thioredoxin family protein [Bacteroidaceae bacterium]